MYFITIVCKDYIVFVLKYFSSLTVSCIKMIRSLLIIQNSYVFIIPDQNRFVK